VPAFFAELTMERGRDRATYEEVEESQADLDRFRNWLAKIEARDYFGSARGDEARDAIARCERDFERFESEAVAQETGARSGRAEISG